MGLGWMSYSQQDTHFSMFYASKSLYNPGAAGFFKGTYQGFANYRQQYRNASDKPYQTISAAFDTRFFESRSGFLGFGVNFYTDGSGDGKYTVNQVAVPINYAIKLNQFNHLSLGISPSFYQRSVRNISGLSWDNQWTGVSFDNAVSSGEGLTTQQAAAYKFDLSAGMYWRGEFSKFSWIGAGFSAQHLTRQDIGLLTTESDLYMEYTLHLHGQFGNQNSLLLVKPNVIAIQQGPNQTLVFGSSFEYLLKEAAHYTQFNQHTSIEFGGFYRWKDAAILSAGFHYSGLTVGTAFDINVSTLGAVAGRFGAMEFYVNYRFFDVTKQRKASFR